jgi:flavin-dependent dehydrogenase
MIRILGAGLSGLSAAINLKKGGKEVVVLERQPAVGMQIHPNYQVIRLPSNISVTDLFNQLNLTPCNPTIKYLNKMILETPRKGIRHITSTDKINFVLRGGEGSLEHALYLEALELGVQFEFSTKQRTADIIATGHKQCDAAAYGEIYEAPEFPQDQYFYMHDDRYAPKGWYSYIVPMGNDRIEIVTCVSQPYVSSCKAYFARLLRENKFVNSLTRGKKPISAFGGFGGVDFPNTAKQSNSLLVGEAAGFQDVSRGFGIAYALRSGYLAAKSILEGSDYDNLWKTHFEEELKYDFAIRFVFSTIGDYAVEWYFKDFKDNTTVDLNSASPKGMAHKLITGLGFPAELMKKKITGFW